MGIDIIIPVYNGYEDIIKCMESIRRHTDLQENRVFLVNDKSPDERILPLLEKQAEQNIIIIDSETNEGFSASVNKGILASDRDVILLNSDTVVTENWVEKIVRCAYSDTSIGTVTPFSNSATLCSVPKFGVDNEIPVNLTVDEMAEIIEKVSVHKYPHITVAVGFCMFIKRSVIQEVGLFDAETFGKGYGEENDFCNRAEQYGYCHVLCDDTFIYHKGTASFASEEKRKLIEKHTKILEKRYQAQMMKNHLYCVQNPDQDLRDHLEPFFKIRNGKKNILYSVHCDFRKDAADHIGGTQLHVKDLVFSLKDKYNVFVMSRDGDYLRLTIYIEDSRISYKFYIGAKSPYFQFHNIRLEKLYEIFMRVFTIDLIHVHHIFGLSLDIFSVAEKYQIPLALTLHDYYYICPTIKLYTHKEKICDGSDGAESCKECMFRNCGVIHTVEYLKKWRENMKSAIMKCSRIYTPSEKAKSIYLEYYPEIGDRIEIIEHGLDMNESIEEPKDTKSKEIKKTAEFFIEQHLSEKSDVLSGWAYIAGMDNKNIDIVIEITDRYGTSHRFAAKKQHRPDLKEINKWYEMAGFSVRINTNWFAPGTLMVKVLAVLDEETECVIWEETYKKRNDKIRNDENLNVAFIGGVSIEKGSKLIKKVIQSEDQAVNWYIFGGIGDRELEYTEQGNLIKTGDYVREELKAMLVNYNIDLICILPVWHETFCYTLSEAVMCGIPVVVTDTGAVADRVRKYQYGWVVSVENGVQECIDLIRKFSKDPSILKKKKRELADMSFKSVDDMAAEYDGCYRNIMKEKSVKAEEATPDDYQILYQGLKVGSSHAKGDYLVAAELNDQLQTILSSTSYKVMLFFAQIRFPFKKQIKALMYKIYKLLRR